MIEAIPVITIDGPSGSGKGTVGLMLASKLGWHLLDSGALYRVLAVAAHRHKVKFVDEANLEILAAHLDVQFISDKQQGLTKIVLEGEDVTQIIRTKVWANAASQVGQFGKVRTALLERQRIFRKAPGLIADGRDMGTVIFPDAIIKIYLDASLEERAHRRYKQLKEKGISVNLTSLLQEMAERDERDRNRQVAPLKPANDAEIIDTTGLSIQEAFTRVFALVDSKLKVSHAK